MTEKIKILIIDDDEVDRISLKRSIKSSGFNAEIITATSMAEGLNAVKNQSFDCIFLDYNLPDSNGLDFLKDHKNELNGAPVIVVTSHGDEKLAVEAMRMGACDYIPKIHVTPEGISQSIRCRQGSGCFLEFAGRLRLRPNPDERWNGNGNRRSRDAQASL